RHRVDAVRLPLQPLGLPPDRAGLPVRLPCGPAAVGAVRVGAEDEDLAGRQGVGPRHAGGASTCTPRCCSRYTAAFCRSPARSWSVSSRRTLPGTPATSEPGGMSAPSSTTAPPATRHPAPMRAPLRTTAPMPISEPSPIVQPWTTALWPTDTFSPMTTGFPASTCSDTLSWRLLPAPTVMVLPSARSTALYQTLAPGPRVTPPITRAPEATNESGASWGVLPATERIEAPSAIVMPSTLTGGERLLDGRRVPGRERVDEGHRQVILVAVEVRTADHREAGGLIAEHVGEVEQRHPARAGSRRDDGVLVEHGRPRADA